MDYFKTLLPSITILWSLIDTILVIGLVLNTYFNKSLILPTMIYVVISAILNVIIFALDKVISKITPSFINIIIPIIPEALNITTTIFLNGNDLRKIFIFGLSVKLLSNVVKLLINKYENIIIDRVFVDIVTISDLITILSLGIVAFYDDNLLIIFATYTTIVSFIILCTWIYKMLKIPLLYPLSILVFIIDFICVLIWLPYEKLNIAFIITIIILKIINITIKLLVA